MTVARVKKELRPVSAERVCQFIRLAVARPFTIGQVLGETTLSMVRKEAIQCILPEKKTLPR